MAVDLSKYIKTGYVPICGCNRLSAVMYVYTQYGKKTQFAEDRCTILIDLGDENMPMWAPSGYYWEEDNLFKKAG